MFKELWETEEQFLLRLESGDEGRRDLRSYLEEMACELQRQESS